MEFKIATKEDIECIMGIICAAQKRLKSQGIDQWQNDYPNQETIKDDIAHNNSYVLWKDKIIVGTVAVIFTGEPTYNKIYNGQWINSGKYAVIHRIAIHSKLQEKGLGSVIIKHVETMCREKNIKSIKIDTHTKNQAMRQLLLKNKFQYCGIIHLKDGSHRVAYEKIVRN